MFPAMEVWCSLWNDLHNGHPANPESRYWSSVGRWKKYAAHLQQLMTALAFSKVESGQVYHVPEGSERLIVGFRL